MVIHIPSHSTRSFVNLEESFVCETNINNTNNTNNINNCNNCNNRNNRNNNNIIINNYINNNNNNNTDNTDNNKNDIQIKLFEPIVIFRGNINESVGSLLRGEIVLTLNKPIEITFIRLEFSGKTKIFCPDDPHLAIGTISEELKIISQKIDFLNHHHSTSYIDNSFSIKLFSKSRDEKIYSTTFSSGIHTFPFEFHLPGSLPESITTKYGLVKYKLKVTIGRIVTTFYSKPLLSAVRKVEIARIVLPDYINSSGIEILGNYEQIIDYQLSIPKKSFFINESIPVNLKIIPLVKKFKLHSIESFLVQKITYTRDGDGNKSEFIQNLINIDFQFNEKDGDDEIGNLIYKKIMKFDLTQYGIDDLVIYHSVNTPLIEIKHELKFCFSLSTPNNNKKKRLKRKICFNVEINLLNHLVKRDVFSLPKYDDVSFYCPCHPEYQRVARFVLGDSFNGKEHGECNNLTCNVEDNKLPRYSKYP